MGRITKYNRITSEESVKNILPENSVLTLDFLDYLKSINRASSTLDQYKHDLDIFFVWNLEFNNNKRFVEVTKREFARFQSHALEQWGWSPKRIRRVKSTLSSLSNFIENILDEEPEYEGYRAVVRKIENPINEAVREKTIFEDEELQRLLDHLVEQKKYMQACMVALAMYSGRRKSELPRFKVSYFDEENVKFGSLYKTPEKVRTKGSKGTGNTGKLLYLYVLKQPFDPYLKLWLKNREEKEIESEWLFPKSDNNSLPVTIDAMDRWTDAYSRFLGKPFYWHSLRHYFTTALSKQALPANVIQDIVGWSSLDMVSLYDDTSADETIGQYFNEDGIKKVEAKSLADL